jgi:hypothetical protein
MRRFVVPIGLVLFLTACTKGGKTPPGREGPAGKVEQPAGEPAAPASLSLEDLVAGLESDEAKTRDMAVRALEERRGAEFEKILAAWKESEKGDLRRGLERVLRIDRLRNADVVAIGEGMGYHPRSHLGGIEGNCLVCAKGRLALRIDRVLKGDAVVGDAHKVFNLIRRLPGHAAHELPKLFEAIPGKNLMLLEAPGRGTSMKDLKALDASFTGSKGIFLLKANPERKDLAAIRASGRINPEVILHWICEYEKMDLGEEKRIEKTLEAMGE